MWVPVVAADSWAVIGSIAGVVGVAVAVALFWLQRRKERRAFGYEVTNRALVRVGREAKGKVQITYDGEAVTDVHLIQVVVRNTGRVPIVRGDFDRPIVLRLGQKVKPLPATLSAVGDPPEMAPSASVSNDTITVEPTLLNPGDRITVSVLVSEYGESADSVDVDVRIAGVREIRRTIDRPVSALAGSFFRSSFSLITIGAVAAVITAVVSSFVTQKHEDTRVVLASGAHLCGRIIRTGPTTMIVSLKGSGTVRSVPISEVRQIKNKAC